MGNNENATFDHWCIVELMGHQRIAGRVTEAPVFGGSLMRVDVPATKKGAGFTKFYGASAIYAITPVEEQVARAVAETLDTRPISEWQMRTFLPAGTESLGIVVFDEDDLDDDFDDVDDDFEGDDAGEPGVLSTPVEDADLPPDFDGEEEIEVRDARGTARYLSQFADGC